MEEELRRGLVGKQRLEALSDGLYAIALTLLVLDLKVPALPEGATNAQLVAALGDVLPRALTWFLSFWVMGILWLGQVRIYRIVHHLSWPVIRVQLLVLACVSLMPFSTALLSEHGDLPAAAVTYSTNVLAIALLGALHTHLIVRDGRLHAAALDAAAVRRLHVRSGVLAGCALAAFALAFVVPRWNMLAMLPLVWRPSVDAAPD